MAAKRKSAFPILVLHALHEERPDFAYSLRYGKSASAMSPILRSRMWITKTIENVYLNYILAEYIRIIRNNTLMIYGN